MPRKSPTSAKEAINSAILTAFTIRDQIKEQAQAISTSISGSTQSPTLRSIQELLDQAVEKFDSLTLKEIESLSVAKSASKAPSNPGSSKSPASKSPPKSGPAKERRKPGPKPGYRRGSRVQPPAVVPPGQSAEPETGTGTTPAGDGDSSKKT